MQNELASSEAGFQITHEYEEARLQWAGGSVPLGDHYGDPTCALLSPEHGWCVVGGEGIVVFDFGGPFSLDDPPRSNKCRSTALWRRDDPPGDGAACWFVTELAAFDASHIRVAVEGHGSLVVNPRTLEWRKL